MGRPKLFHEPRVVTGIRLPVTLRDQLHRAADEHRISVNHLVVHAVRTYLDELASPAEPAAPHTRLDRPSPA